MKIRRNRDGRYIHSYLFNRVKSIITSGKGGKLEIYFFGIDKTYLMIHKLKTKLK
jgi:hypothetical protein